MTLPPSLRWRLPISYGAIALIATISLGAVLLLTLNQYYVFQERQYLFTNAQAIGTVVESIPENPDTKVLQAQISALASLIQTRVRIFDAQDALLADSGLPQQNDASTTLSLRVESDGLAQEFSQTTQTSPDSQQFTSSLTVQTGDTRLETTTVVEQERLPLFNTPLAILETPYSFGLGVTNPDIRSNQVVLFDVLGFEDKLIGRIELSQGPAFGRAILTSVAWGVGIAGLIAVMIATAMGWVVSRRLSQPIAHLARVSNRMAAGDLQARATVTRQDEIGELANAFNDMSDQLSGLIGTLRHFVADAAHELRTPLTALRTNLDLAAQASANGRLTPENDFLPQAQSQLNRIQMLTEDLLHLSQLENSATPFEKRPFNLTMLLASNQERYAAAVEQAELNFEVHLPSNPIWINGNETLLLRAFNNLIDNSIKFTPAGGSVGLELKVEAGTAVCSLTDSGIGIEGDPSRIFARFYRGPNTADYPGSGLGLAITKTIIESHGGQIEATSLSPGTKISVILPTLPP